MYYDEICRIVFSTIKENDPHRASKKLHLSRWILTYRCLFTSAGANRLPFFLDVLTDNDCWEETDTIHRVRLNRRVAAKKIVKFRSWTGRTNPLDDFDRFQVACWCCLKEEIIALFKRLKRKFKVRMNDKAATGKLISSLSRASWSDPMTRYWLYIVGYHTTTQIKSEDKNLLLYGLTLASNMQASGKEHFVEAVEYFWGKIKSLPEDELNTEQKQEVLMKTALTAAMCSQSETFEFCFSELSPERYSEYLQRDFDMGGTFHCCIAALHDMFRVDLLKKCFDTFEPDDISEDVYQLWAESLNMDQYSEPYESEAVKLFMHIWTKEGFDSHRAFILRKLCDWDGEEDQFLVRFVKKNHMEPVWAVLDKASRFEIAEFIDCEHGEYIKEILEEKGDLLSLNKFLSYKPDITSLKNERSRSLEANFPAPETKRPRLEKSISF